MNLFTGVLCIFAGIFVLFSRFQRWDWFMNHVKVRFTENVFGTRGADIVYIICSLWFIVLGILFMTNVIG